MVLCWKWGALREPRPSTHSCRQTLHIPSPSTGGPRSGQPRVVAWWALVGPEDLGSLGRGQCTAGREEMGPGRPIVPDRVKCSRSGDPSKGRENIDSKN